MLHLFMTLSPTYVGQLSTTLSAVCLLVSRVLRSAGFGVITLDFSNECTVLEPLMEVAVLICLVVPGASFRVPLSDTV